MARSLHDQSLLPMADRPSHQELMEENTLKKVSIDVINLLVLGHQIDYGKLCAHLHLIQFLSHC